MITMTKKKYDDERPMMLMTRELNGLSPATAADQELLAQYGIGSTLEVRVWQNRSTKHLALYWVVLKMCVDNSEGKYGRSDELHEALKVALGYTRRIRLLGDGPGKHMVKALTFSLLRLRALFANHPGLVAEQAIKIIDGANKIVEQLTEHVGDTILLPGSISLAKMDQADFRVFFDRAMEQLRVAEYPVDAYLQESKKMLARFRPATPLPAKHGEYDDGEKAAA